MNDMMIQNSISQRKPEQKTSSAKSRIPTAADYEKFQLGATPYEAKGHLVHTPIWKTPIVEIKDSFESIKNIGRGIKGQSNDHELGQMNDLAMKAGGLGLAGYLATKRVLPAQKGMEFIGFASFFASMVVFPKLFITTPIKAMYGFNVDQKCIDSQGRKNNLHRDPQYFASDLYSSEQLDAIGDKMGVDKDMENRQDFVKRKMTKISTQANTLWMLTAGLATPIMGALISNRIEKGLKIAQEKAKTNQVDNKLKKLGDDLKNADTIANDQINKKELETLLQNNKNKVIDQKFFEQLVKVMDKGNSLKIETHLRKDLNLIVNHNEIDNVAQFLDDITVEVNQKKGNKPFSIKFEKNEIEKALEKANLNKKQTVTADNIIAIKNRLHNDLFASGIQEITDDNLIEKLENSFNSQIQSRLEKASITLTQDKIENLKSAFKSIENFQIKNNILKEYVSHKIGQKEDSVIAKEWSKASSEIIETMGFSYKELQEMKKSPAKSTEIFTAKMAEIAKDDAKYTKVLKKTAKLVNEFEQAITKGSGRKDKDGNLLTFEQEVIEMTNKFHDDFAGRARKSGLNNLADYIAGSTEGAAQNLPNCAKKNAITFVESSIAGAKGSIYKMIQGLDMFRRLEADKSKQIKPDVAQKMIHTLMNGTYGDHFVKLDIQTPEMYQKVMENLYTTNLDAKTKEILGQIGPENNKLLTRFEVYIIEVGNQLGKYKNRFLEHKSKVNDAETKPAGNFVKQAMAGNTLSNIGSEAAEQMHNTKHWLRLFGGIGIGVAAVTLISPLFFGKITPPQKKVKAEVENNG